MGSMMRRGGLGREALSMSGRAGTANGAKIGPRRTVSVLVVALLLAPPAPARAVERARPRAQADDGRVGQRVVARSRRLVLRDGPRDITVEGPYRYRIRRALGHRLLVEPEGLGVS